MSGGLCLFSNGFSFGEVERMSSKLFVRVRALLLEGSISGADFILENLCAEYGCGGRGGVTRGVLLRLPSGSCLGAV